MEQSGTNTVADRTEAGLLLGKKLALADLNNAVVIGVPHGGIGVASVLAEYLDLPLEIMPCRKIKDPSDQTRNIGSVSADEVVLRECPYGVPQDYLYFQTVRLRSEINTESKYYYGTSSPATLHFKTVILVDDILLSSDTLIACLRDIRKQTPIRIIVAVPFVEAEAARIIKAESDDLIFLKLQQPIHSPNEYYNKFPPVDKEEVRELFNRSREFHRRIPHLNEL